MATASSGTVTAYEITPSLIHYEEVNREKDNRDQRDDGRVFYFFWRRPRNALHFRAHIAQELPEATDWARARTAQTALATRASTLSTLAKTTGAGGGQRRVLVFHFIHNIADFIQAFY